jgi:chemotaxis protein histidine kinase CheA
MNSAFEMRFDGIRRRFVERAIDQCAALERFVAAFDAGVADPATRAEVGRIAHSLSGAGGTFRFAGISSSAGELEDLAQRPREPSALAQACRTLIAEIKRATA